MIIVPLVLLVGGIVAVAYGSARDEVRQERREKEEERAYQELQALQERAYKEAREDAKDIRDRQRKLEDRDEAREYVEDREPHEEATYLVPYYAQLVGVSMMWELKALPVPAQLTLDEVRDEGLVFHGVPGVVPFDHIERVVEVGVEDDGEGDGEGDGEDDVP